MNEDFEHQLRSLQPADPAASLKNRLRAHLEPKARKVSLPVFLLRLGIPAACALVVAGLAVSRRGPATAPTTCTYGRIPAEASTSLYFQDGEPPLQVIRTSSQAYVAWHDPKAGQEVLRTFPCEQIVIAPLSIQ